ncbi:hypothetical protein C8J56DRAFT_831164 [Mycena floridula]|nr:hypothetical protein C8J56DRAFT_831164 [Mycena floridula]
MVSIQNVIQLGASGSTGSPVLEALLAAGTFNVSVLTRETSTSTFPDGVTVVKADYESHKSLVKALTGQDAIVITLGGSFDVLEVIQKAVFEAAVEVGIKHIIPSSYGSDLSTEIARSQPVFAPKIRSEAYLAELASQHKFNYTVIATGPFLDWGLVFRFLGIDLVNKKATLIDNGTRKVNHTLVASIGLAVVSILSNPNLIKNRTACIHDFFVSQREILEIAETELGVSFEITHVDSEELQRECEPGLATWDPASVGGLIQVAGWGKNSSSAWGTDDDSKALGLTSKDLRQEVVKVINQLKLRE